jgi:hypothetical protein
MFRNLISFAATFVTLGGGILATIVVVKQLNAPLLVFPGIIAILAAVAGVGLLTAPGRSFEEKLRWLSRSLEGTS